MFNALLNGIAVLSLAATLHRVRWVWRSALCFFGFTIKTLRKIDEERWSMEDCKDWITKLILEEITACLLTMICKLQLVRLVIEIFSVTSSTISSVLVALNSCLLDLEVLNFKRIAHNEFIWPWNTNEMETIFSRRDHEPKQVVWGALTL